MTLAHNRNPSRIGALAALIVIACTVAACKPAPPIAGSVLIDCDRAAQRITVTVNSHLDPDCTYSGGFDITASNTTFDCQGATIRNPDYSTKGIQISAPVGHGLHDVTVKNCHIEGFMNGIRITRPGFQSLPAGGEFADDLHDITVVDSSVADTQGSGLYVDGYVTGVTISHDNIQNTGGSGIYLEAGSKGTTVEHTILAHDGYLANGPGGQLTSFGGINVWFWGTGREGLSIDGSFDNTIKDNVFWNNSNGGIQVYKNCGEYPDKPGYFERRYPATGNLITGNTFVDELTGVWVGSRMAENTIPMDCAAPAYIDKPLQRIVLDHAPGNTVEDNDFVDTTYGVRVEDDDNQVIGNRFSAASPDHHAILIGTPYRASVLNEPVTGTVLRNNSSDIVGNTDPYRWIDGTTGTVDENNTALGAPTAVCPGVEPWRSPFIFVVALAAPGPGGGPPATTPDTSVPTIGALPPCTR